jgi:hypothetical protein
LSDAGQLRLLGYLMPSKLVSTAFFAGGILWWPIWTPHNMSWLDDSCSASVDLTEARNLPGTAKRSLHSLNLLSRWHVVGYLLKKFG